jgi:hypothetical protein
MEICKSSEHSSVAERAFFEISIRSISCEVSSGERSVGGI